MTHERPLKRLTIKVGTSLIDSETHHFNREGIGNLCAGIARLMEKGLEVVLVSSGAVGAGRRKMQWKQDQTSLIDRQALAAIGQPRLMNFYTEIFREWKTPVAQVLLTRTGLENRKRYLNARNTLERLLAWKVLPIINENDTVVTEELQFGDNDRLAALVAGKTQSQLLVLLTDVDSVWDQENRPVHRVSEISASLLAAAGGPASARSRGGMKSKLRSVQEAMLMGVSAVITSGRLPDIIGRVVDAWPGMIDLSKEAQKEIPGTWFIAQAEGIRGRKRWILACGSVNSRILVDAGARVALERGDRSLLPSGVVAVEGIFEAGDPVAICSLNHHPIAQGLANLSSVELSRFMGKSTQEIREAIGRNIKTCVAVHHDDMVLMSSGNRDPVQTLD
jgi:glutamate 5-kinase